MLRLTVPTIEEDDQAAVREVLASGYLVQGPKVKAFEDAVAKYVGAKHAVAVSNCTAALHLALLALEVGPGDLVVVTSYSWVSSANAIELCGAQPVFTDIDPTTCNMDPDSLSKVMTRLRSTAETRTKVKAILPVHAFGQVADMRRIMEIANEHAVPVVEDAACALGASLSGKNAGTWGAMGCFSFHPRKAITTGEGGIVTTESDELAWQLKALRNHGQDPYLPTPEFVMPGYNYRLTELQGALGLSQMGKVDRIIAARRAAAQIYDKLFSRGALSPLAVSEGSEPVYQSYVALLSGDSRAARDGLIKRLREQGIEVNIGTWHLPMTSYYRKKYGYEPGDFPGTDTVFESALSLPLFEGLTAGSQNEVYTKISSALGELAASSS